MPRPVVDRSKEIEAVIKRAEACRMTATALANAAGVHVTTMSRARTSGRIDLATLDKLERAATDAEAERIK